MHRGAMQVGDYTSAIEAAGLRVTQVRDNPQYQFISKNAKVRRASMA